MGIQGLMKLLSEESPGSIKEHDLEYLCGRKIAIDASMAMYQFLVAVRTQGDAGGHAAMLTNEAGEITSHIQGMFNRTIKMITSGVKPVYVFDGKPPQMKGGELAKRIARRAQAEASLEASKEAGDVEDVNKFSRRLVKVTRQHNDDCKQLLRLMGVPVVDAPCEAEAQCAELAKKGKVYAAATEDMDALTFRTPLLLRKLTFTGSKQPIIEINLEIALSGLGITYEQFVDLCILCGCDYCGSIKGIGPKTALKLIKQHGNLEKVVHVLGRDKKYQIPVDWKIQKVKKVVVADVPDSTEKVEEEAEDIEKDNEVPAVQSEVVEDLKGDDDDEVVEVDALEEDTEDPDDSVPEANKTNDSTMELAEDEELVDPLYAQARHLFIKADVLAAESIELKWTEPDEEGLKAFLVQKMGFNEDRVMNAIKKLKESQPKQAQQRLESFFKPLNPVNGVDAAKKRKADNGKADAGKSKAAKGSWAGKKR